MIEQKVAIVTGSGDGIGKAIASRLSADGHFVAIVDIHAEAAETVCQEIIAAGGSAMAVTADVSNEQEVQKAVRDIVKETGRIDILVNNASINRVQSWDEITLDDWETLIRVNLNSVFICCKAVVPYLKEHGWGRIINAASHSAYKQGVNTIAYGTTKWAVRGFTRHLAMALGPYNITVNGYCPGKVHTQMFEKVLVNSARISGKSYEEVFEAASKNPLGRLQTPEDIAAIVSFLASEQADNITGQNIMVNAGEVMC